MKEKRKKNKNKTKKQRAKACCSGAQALKNMRLAILFYMFLNPRFKTTTGFANIARTTASILLIFQIYQTK